LLENFRSPVRFGEGLTVGSSTRPNTHEVGPATEKTRWLNVLNK